MRHLRGKILLLAVIAAAPACYYDADTGAAEQADDYPLPPAAAPPAGTATLPGWPAPSGRRELLVTSQASSLSVTVVDPNTHAETPRTLPVVGGVLGFSSDAGALALEDLQVVLGDAHLPTPGSADIVLTGLRLESRPNLHLPVSWREPGHQGFLMAPVTLQLEWKVVGESGRAWPLTTQTLEGATLHVHVSLGPDGRLRADAVGIDTGTFWQRAGLCALKDAVLTLVAREPATGE